MTFYRIFFRKPKSAGWHERNRQVVVEGEAERDRILAQRAPKAIHCEEAVERSCCVCGRRGPWEDDDWRWFGSEDDLEQGVDVDIYCGKACVPPAKREIDRSGGERYKAWKRLWAFEPATNRFERWNAIRDADQAVTAHRKVPMPDWPGPGSCRWCLKPTIWEKGKRKGQLAPGRNWHNDCYERYLLHTHAETQARFLSERDAPWCALCGKKDGRWVSAGTVWHDPVGETGLTRIRWSEATQVDHVIPLWKVMILYPDLELDDHRLFYGPENLWLLCLACHKRKTADEAAERAQRRKGEEDGRK